MTCGRNLRLSEGKERVTHLLPFGEIREGLRKIKYGLRKVKPRLRKIRTSFLFLLRCIIQ